MNLENIQSDASSPLITDLEKSSNIEWNGRRISKSQLSEISREIRNSIFLNHTVIESRPLEVNLCGARVDTSVSISAEMDTKGNKSAGAEVEVNTENKDRDVNTSTSIEGSVNQDSQGNTKGEVKGRVTVKF